MKILQVLFSGLGGHGSVAFSIVRGDRRLTHRHAMIFYGIEPLAAGYQQSCDQLGVAYDVVYKRPGLDLRSWGDIVGSTDRAAPDVILLHSTSVVAVAVPYARAAGIPIVVVDHLSNQVKQGRDWRFTALALGLADRTVFLTKEFAAEVAARMGRLYSHERVEVIGNGIDIASFAGAAAGKGPTDKPLRAGMHSRFSASKDHFTLVRSIARLRDARLRDARLRDAAPPLNLALAGDGETLAATRQLTHDLGLDDQVEFLGMLPESALPDYLGSLDIYVQSSRGETMSTGVMQAMAAGLPVVASRVPGLESMVAEDQTGCLFPLGDDSALAGLLGLLASDPERRARLGRQASAHARQHWSNETMFQAYESLLSSLAAQKRPRRPAFRRQLSRFSRALQFGPHEGSRSHRDEVAAAKPPARRRD